MKNSSDSRSSNPYSSSSIRRRSETQPIQSSRIYGRHGYQSSIIPRKLIQHSTFLPSIGKSQRNQKRHHDRWRSQGEIYESSNTIDTQSETMEYLNECERIIENLKKLTTISSKKVQRVRSSIPNYPHSRHNSDVERQPSFFGSIQNSQESSFRNKKNEKIPSKNSTSKYSKILEQSPEQSFRNSKQLSKNTKKNQIIIQNGKGKLSSLSNQSISLQNFPNSKMNKTGQQSDRKKQKQKSQLKSKDYVNQFDQESQQINEKDEQLNEELQHLKEAKQIEIKAQQQLRKAQKKQKFLMKYLSKAKSSGCQLHKKIIENKLKHKESGGITSRTIMKDKKIDNPEQIAADKKQAANQQSDIQHKKSQNQNQNGEKIDPKQQNKEQNSQLKLIQQTEQQQIKLDKVQAIQSERNGENKQQ